MATTYTQEFRGQSLKLSDEIGLKKAAERLGISYNTLSNWRQKRERYGKAANVGSGHVRVEPGHEHEAELERKVTELERANDILKEALSFFVNDRKK